MHASSGSSPAITVAREWIAKAENDLTNARHTLTLGKSCPTDTVCFHAQQTVEKYLKATLSFHSTAFPKTHDIEVLTRLSPAGLLAHWPLSEQRRLSAYATVSRYPGAYPPITLSEAKAAVAIARKVRAEILRHLPSAAYRQMGTPRHAARHRRKGKKSP